MLDKYITIKDKTIICGQYPSSGAWYCKDLPADNLHEMDELIAETIKILNKHNKTINVKETKDKDIVRGLKP